MLTRDEVVQLILYLIVATVLLLGSRVRAQTMEHGSRKNIIRDNTYATQTGNC